MSYSSEYLCFVDRLILSAAVWEVVMFRLLAIDSILLHFFSICTHVHVLARTLLLLVFTCVNKGLDLKNDVPE